MARPKNKVNPFLLQRQIRDSVRSLPKEKRDLLGQAYLNVLNDFKIKSLNYLKEKYFNESE